MKTTKQFDATGKVVVDPATGSILGQLVEVKGAWKTYRLRADGSLRKIRNAVIQDGPPEPRERASGGIATSAAAKPSKAKGGASEKAQGVTVTRSIAGSPVRTIAKYQTHRTRKGKLSLDNGDAISLKLRALALSEVYGIVADQMHKADFSEFPSAVAAERFLRGKYSALNLGMQRMNLGNRYRALVGEKA